MANGSSRMQVAAARGTEPPDPYPSRARPVSLRVSPPRAVEAAAVRGEEPPDPSCGSLMSPHLAEAADARSKDPQDQSLGGVSPPRTLAAGHRRRGRGSSSSMTRSTGMARPTRQDRQSSGLPSVSLSVSPRQEDPIWVTAACFSRMVFLWRRLRSSRSQ
jgi:hypothetical protein